jgi:hypothetical protein
LRIETIGVNDNFFDLGGNSLLLLQVRSKLKGRIDRKISVIELFQYPTVRLLVNHLSRDDAVPPSIRLHSGLVENRRAAMHRQRQVRAGYRREKELKGHSR